MALIHHRAREIHFKIVYYGPSEGGKTTNLRILNERLPANRRGKLLSIATEQERTLFFDFMPIELAPINGLSTRFHLYTVPGQVYYRLSRRAVLQGLDAVVFVADSHPARENANRESMDDLNAQLASIGQTPAEIARMPRAIQYNKRDLASALPVARLSAALNPRGFPEFEAVASAGKGVSETLRCVLKGVLARLIDPEGQASTPASASASAPSAGAPAPVSGPRAGALEPASTARPEAPAPPSWRPVASTPATRPAPPAPVAPTPRAPATPRSAFASRTHRA